MIGYIVLGHRKKDEICEPLLHNSVGMQFLHHALRLFKNWNLSGQRGLRKETFLARIQSIEAMLALIKYLLEKYNFKNVLPEKFVSDPLEARFG